MQFISHSSMLLKLQYGNFYVTLYHSSFDSFSRNPPKY